MPKSKVRKRSVYTPPVDQRTPAQVRAVGPSHPFYVAVMLGLMLLGLAWLVVYYLAGDKVSVLSDLGNYNFLIGFALMIVGLFMTMRWR